MAGEDAPPAEGGADNANNAGDEPPATDPKSKAIKAGAVGALGVGATQAALMFTGKSKFGIGKIFRTGSSVHAAGTAPVAYVQETKVEKANTMRGELNKIREEHGRFSEQNDVLSGNIDALQVETARMNECADALNDIAQTQNADLEKLMALIEENKKIAREMKKIMKKKALEEVVNMVIESDSDMDFTVGNGQELEELVLHLKEVPDLDFNEELFRKVVVDNDGDMRLVLKCIFGMMPDNEDVRAMPEQNGREEIEFDEVADSHQVKISAPRSANRSNNLQTINEKAPLLDTASSKASSAPAINFLEDNHADMTLSRRIALRLMNSKWYYPAGCTSPKEKDKDEDDDSSFDDNPVKEPTKIKSSVNSDAQETKDTDKPPKPSLAQAWAFFEHNTLPRYLFQKKPDDWERPSMITRVSHKMSKANKQMDRAEPGESNLETRLYSPIFTPLTQMGDFGIGVGLYFSTLRFLTILTLMAGFINIPIIRYYASNEYSGGQSTLRFTQKGSAICTNTTWVPCIDCYKDNATERYANSPIPVNDSRNFTFVKKFNCDPPTETVGYVSYGTLFFVSFGILVMEIFQKNMEVKFDEDEQTTQDYSIKVLNPPGDAKDPEEWKAFFEGFYDNVHVTCCTVGVDNQQLLEELITRREMFQKIRYSLPYGTPTDSENLRQVCLKIETNRNFFQRMKAKLISDVPEWYQQMKECDSKILELSKKEYFSTCVFITFETEDAQRRVLSSMYEKEFLFRSEHKLNVLEADEPSSILWQFLNTTRTDKIKIYFLTYIAHVASVLGAVGLIYWLNLADETQAIAPTIAISNQIFPRFALMLTNFEKHESRDSLEVSLYVKIVVFRWINTAVVTQIVTPFSNTLDEEGLIPGIFAIFVAEIVISNVIQIVDISGNIKRHFLAPRAQTQEKMNGHFMGGEYFIAERYTNVTKILFLCLFYATLYPATYFLCALSLFINFFSDRFSLMRSWKQIGKVGPKISRISRRIFCNLAVLIFAYIASYYWAGFPFDNLCESDNIWLLDSFEFTTKSVEKTPKELTISVEPGDMLYQYCNQNMINNPPPLPHKQEKKYMTPNQETIVSMFGYTSIVLLCASIFLYIVRNIIQNCSKDEAVGEDQGIPFSTIDSVCAYIPEVNSSELAYPLIACRIDTFDHELFEWQNPDIPYEEYDLTKDVDLILKEKEGLEKIDNDIFSRISHWPPKDS